MMTLKEVENTCIIGDKSLSTLMVQSFLWQETADFVLDVYSKEYEKV